MHSGTILLLLAFSCLSSGTIYFFTGHEDKVQVQANLILHAFRQPDVVLLYKLIQYGDVVDRYLKTHPNWIQAIQIEKAEKVGDEYKAIAKIQVGKGVKQYEYNVKMDLSPSSSSPTGYIMSHAEQCGRFVDCSLDDKFVGFY